MLNRRTLLQSIGVGSAALAFSTLIGPRRALAQSLPERSFVFCYFRGGWDTLMSLDPRDPAVFTDARRGETLIELAWDRLPAAYPREIIRPQGSNIDFGPVMGSIAPHFDKMCVVRGVNMNTVAHEVGRKYFITGKEPRGTQAAGSAVPTRIVAQQGDLSALPNLVVRVETYNDGDPAFASGLTVNSVQDLITTLTDGPAAPSGAVRTHLDAYRSRAAHCDPSRLDRRGILSAIRDSQAKARQLVAGDINTRFNFLNANDPEMSAIRDRYGITTLTSPEAQAAMALQALKYEAAQVVTIELASNLDTHDDQWDTTHPADLAQAFTALSQLVTDLAGEPDPTRGGVILDHTTILCFSEFGRTALINNRDGRDHSLTSSALLLGAGVPHNKVVGASSDVGMAPRTIDPTTGAPSDGGVEVTPTEIVASIMRSAGLDTYDLRTEGLPCLIA